MLDQGGDGRAFETIVATGPHSSIPHHQPTDGRSRAATSSSSTSAPSIGGYHADMTRTLVARASRRDWQREIYDLVARSQAAGRAAAGRSVPTASGVDRAARDGGRGGRAGRAVPARAGARRRAGDPRGAAAGASRTGTLDAGIPFTVEPGVYLPGRGGVRIEDTLVVTAGGARAAHHHDQGAARRRLTRGQAAARQHVRTRGEGLKVATTNDLKNGLVLNIDGQLWTVVEFQHVKPGKGPAFVRTKLKHVLSGKVVDKTFNAGVKVETANVDKRTMQYLYNEGTDFVFMDTETYEQLHVPADTVGDAANYLLENQDGDGRHARRRARSTSSCPPPSSWRSPTPSRACRATAPPAARSRRRSRPAPRSRCRCSSPRARRSRSTPATAPTSAASRAEASMAARSKARKRALDVLFESEQRGVDPLGDPGASGVPRADPPVHEYTVEPGRGRRGASQREIDQADRVERPRAGRWTGCPRWTARSCGSAPGSSLHGTTYPDAWSSTRRWSWPSSCRPTSRRHSSTACSPRVLRTRTSLSRCPRWDSNPHRTDFESAASAGWATGAACADGQSRTAHYAGPHEQRPATRRHRRGRGAHPPRPQGDARGGGLLRRRRGRRRGDRRRAWPTSTGPTW